MTGSLARWRLVIEYDGTDFSGWQRQEEGIPTVQGAVEAAIKGFCQQDVTLHVAGRTDAGVHAAGQVAHFDLDYGARPLAAEDLAKAINAHLRPLPVSILRAEIAAADFHARFAARSKTYLYRIINRPAPPAREGRLAWHVRRPLDDRAMQAGARYLVGHHDFTTFRDTECQAKSPLKTIDRLDVTAHEYDDCGGREIRITAVGKSFLHHQVRNMAGTLALVGEGKWSPDDVREALAARDRRRGGPTAPAQGLCLMRVEY